MTKIYTIEGGQKDVSSLDGTTLKNNSKMRLRGLAKISYTLRFTTNAFHKIAAQAQQQEYGYIS